MFGVWVGGGPASNAKGNYSTYAVTDTEGKYRVRVPEGQTRIFLKNNSHIGTQIKNPPTATLAAHTGKDNRQDFIVEGDGAELYTGTIVDQSGKPVANADLEVADTLGGWTWRTNMWGRYHIVLNWGKPQNHALIVRQGGLSGTATLTPGTEQAVTAALTKQTAATVQGTVLDEDHKPIEGAKVRILRASGNLLHNANEVQTDRSGNYRCDVSPLYRYAIEAQATGYGVHSGFHPQIVVTAGAVTTVHEILLPKANGSIKARVVDEVGRPITEAMVNLYGWQTLTSARTDRQGYFLAQNVVIGDTFQMRITKGDAQWLNLPLTADKGQDIVLRKADRNRMRPTTR